MELIKVTDKTYYISNRTNIGVYKVNKADVYIIDSGNDKEAGKKILKIIEKEGWNIKGIISTHSNADHIGGNQYIKDKTKCAVLSNGIEIPFMKYPILEPAFLYGGYPLNELKNKFLMAKATDVTNIQNKLPEGLEYFDLKGHFFDMIGIKTDDNIYFLGDSLFSEETINKYHIFFIYDVKEFLNTLEFLEKLNGKLYVLSHVTPTKDISHLINVNRNKINEIIKKISDYCQKKRTFEEILKYLFDFYKLDMNVNQYVLIGCTIKSYLSYMDEQNILRYEFVDNKMYWEIR